jgi:hypothetical protein
MQTIEIDKGIQVAFDDLMRGIRKMDISTLEQLAGEVNSMIARRKSSPETGPETEVLNKIKNLVPASVQRRYKQLHGKLQKETITKREHQELLQIVDFMEEKTVERVHLLAELAALRGVSLSDLGTCRK